MYLQWKPFSELRDKKSSDKGEASTAARYKGLPLGSLTNMSVTNEKEDTQHLT